MRLSDKFNLMFIFVFVLGLVGGQLLATQPPTWAWITYMLVTIGYLMSVANKIGRLDILLFRGGDEEEEVGVRAQRPVEVGFPGSPEDKRGKQ